MVTRVTGTLALVAALLGCGASSASQHRPTLVAHQCGALGDVNGEVAKIYSEKITSVRPVYRKEFIARAIQPRYVAGAELYLPAEAHTNEAYLERVLTCHAASSTGSSHPNDPLRVAGVKDVDVDAAGSSYRISVLGRDRAAGKAIFERARMLQKAAGQVRVKQVASADGPVAF